MVGVGFTLANDPMYTSATFTYTWALAGGPCTDPDASPALTPTIDVQAGVHVAGTQRTSSSGVTNDMLLPPPGYANQKDRTAVWSQRFDSFGLSSGAYCVLLTACRGAVHAADGTLDMDERCKNATSSEVTVDRTPPEGACETLEPQNASVGAPAWPMRIPFACEDAESGIPQASLALGVIDAPSKYLLVPINATSDAEDGNETVANNTTSALQQYTGLEGVFVTASNGSSLMGFAVVNEAFFGMHRAGDELRVTLTCYNALGSSSTAMFQPIFDAEPPEQPQVSFTSLGVVWSSRQNAWVTSAASAAAGVTLAWHSVDDGAVAGYSVCVSRQTTDGCDVQLLQVPHTTVSAMLDSMTVPTHNGTSSPYSSMAFSIDVQAFDTLGRISRAHTSLLVDATPPAIGRLLIEALTGSDATAAGAMPSLSNRTAQAFDTVIQLEVIGGASDDDVPEGLEIIWTLVEEPGGVVGTASSCTYEQRVPSEWVWEARCSVTESSRLCFAGAARSVAGLLSNATNQACVDVRLTLAHWPADPVLRYESPGFLNVTWAAPSLPLSTQRANVTWSLCTAIGCLGAVATSGAQRSAQIDLDAPLLHNYSGLAWVVLRASPPGGDSSVTAVATSHGLAIGGSGPVDGQLRLVPGRVQSLSQLALWVDGFDDPVHGISSFRWCLGTAAGAEDLLACRVETTLPRRLDLGDLSPPATFGLDAAQPPPQNATAVVTVSACNRFGECIAGVSNVIAVDGEPPLPGYVADGLLISAPAQWDDVKVLECDDDDGGGLGGGDGGVTEPCALAPLLAPNLDAIQRESAIAAHRALTLASTNVERLQRGGARLAASWGGFSDAGSDLGHIELCFSRIGDEGDSSPSSSSSSSSSSSQQWCVQVEPVGMVIGPVVTPTDQQQRSSPARWQVTAHVRDQAGNQRNLTSAGVEHFSRPPVPGLIRPLLADGGNTAPDGPYDQSPLPPSLAPDGTLFSPSCSELRIRWAPFNDSSCASDARYEWRLCDAIGNCTAGLVLPRGTTNLSLVGELLHPGVRYDGRLAAVGCAGEAFPALGVSAGLVCDSSEPLVAGYAPSLVTATGQALAANTSSTVIVAWPNVFHDAESLATARCDVCLTNDGSSSCPNASSWHNAGRGSTSVTLPVPLEFVSNPLATEVGAVVRVTNAVGRTATATADVLSVDHWPPTIGSLSVDGYGVNKNGDAQGPPCVLNRTSMITVRWTSEDEGSGLHTHSVSLAPLASDRVPLAAAPIVVATVPSGVPSSIVVYDLLGVSAEMAVARAVRVEVVANDQAGLNGTASMTCTISTATPQVEALVLPNATQLFRPGLYAVDPEEAQALTVCWRVEEGGSADSPADVDHFLYWVSRHGAANANSRSLRSSSALLGDHVEGTELNLTEPLRLDASEACVEDTNTLTHGQVYTLRLAAVGKNGMQSLAEALVVADATPALPTGGAPVIHTGASSPSRQTSACCLRLSWAPWADDETYVARYLLCTSAGTLAAHNASRAATDDLSCLDVALATHVLISAPGQSCDCEPPSSAIHLAATWQRFQHPLALPVNGSMGFTLHAVNGIGLASPATGPFTVSVDVPPKLPTSLRFAGQSTMVAPQNSTDVAATCPRNGANTSVDVWHPAGHIVQLEWDSEEAEGIYGLVYVFCVQGGDAGAAATTTDDDDDDCTVVDASLGATTLRSLDAGRHTVTLEVRSAGGARADATWSVLADPTGPQMGHVRVEDGVGYWNTAERFACTFAAAMDPESGVAHYEVALINVSAGGPCGTSASVAAETAGGGYGGGSLLSRQEVHCPNITTDGVRVVFDVPLVHGGRYRCAVTAINGAGLRTGRSSADTVVDAAETCMAIGPASSSSLAGSSAIRNAAAVGDASGGSQSVGAISNSSAVHVEFAADFLAPLSASTPALASAAAMSTAPQIAPLDLFEAEIQRLPRDETEELAVAGNATSSSQDVVAFPLIGERLLLGASTASPCCLVDALPPGPAVRHDAWLVGGPPSSTSVATLGAHGALLAAAGQLMIVSLEDGADDADAVSVNGALFDPPAFWCNRSGTLEHEMLTFGSQGGAWMLAACGKLHVYRSALTPSTQPTVTIEAPDSCAAKAAPFEADRWAFAAEADHFFVLSSCAVSAADATTHSIQLTQYDWASNPTGSTSRLLTGTVASADEAVCRGCIAADGGLIAVPSFDATDCALGGAVRLYDGVDTAMFYPKAQVQDANLSLAGSCALGRATLLLNSTLVIGAPTADSGRGAVSVWDVTDLATPTFLCHWMAPAGATGYGSALAAQPADPAAPHLRLVAVGSTGASLASVEQILLTGSPTRPVCASPGGAPVATVVAAGDAPAGMSGGGGASAPGAAQIAFTSTALVVLAGASPSGSGLISLTAFCPRNQVRAHALGLPWGWGLCSG